MKHDHEDPDTYVVGCPACEAERPSVDLDMVESIAGMGVLIIDVENP